MPYFSPYLPIGFDVFGLDEGWDGGRWLEMIEGSNTELYGLRLGHGSRHLPLPEQPWAMVTSYHMPTLDKGSPRHLYPQEAADRGLFSLYNHTEPPLTKQERSGYFEAAMKGLRVQAMQWADWPTSAWTVDGHDVQAHYFEWADAWTGFTIQGDVGVVVNATGLAPENFRLQRLTDALAYHINLRQPLLYPESIIRSQAAAGIRDDERSIPWPRHRDHEQLLIDI